MTLALTDGGVTARRALAVELTPPLLEADEDLTQLRGLTVTVAARAKAKDFVWGVAPAAGGSFASFANVNGFASAGGSAAALSLATDATVLFNADGLALSLTLTLTAESGEETTGTVTFVSSAREFNGTGLSTLIVTAALAAGTEVFAATDAGLTIWHSPNESEFYTLEGANANLFDASAAGAVSARDEIRPTELVRYELTLALSDGGVTARRGLTVELTPPLLNADEDLSELSGLRVTVEARAEAGSFVWGVAPPGGSFASFANVNGFASAGGSAAALSLATDATVLFNADGLALSLTLTLTAESGEEATGTVTFVSSAREFNGTGLSTLIVTAALAMGDGSVRGDGCGLDDLAQPERERVLHIGRNERELVHSGRGRSGERERRDTADGVGSLRIDAGVDGRGSDGAAGVGGGIDAAVVGGGRGFDAVARIDGDGGGEGESERFCVGRGAGGGREFCAVRECERIRERGRLGGGVVVGDGRDGVV